ncbi:hypothetical protein CDAR_405981 [Caerostris darwini]|uniref:Uncharacterized protein n=1 Tax=Caerostris darwini TaxID=1538125 RepID=A0AAV4TR38_9ARAC|nr:hypothetical protein CDAR_405981 [Caerostris darwini]
MGKEALAHSSKCALTSQMFKILILFVSLFHYKKEKEQNCRERENFNHSSTVYLSLFRTNAGDCVRVTPPLQVALPACVRTRPPESIHPPSFRTGLIYPDGVAPNPCCVRRQRRRNTNQFVHPTSRGFSFWEQRHLVVVFVSDRCIYKSLMMVRSWFSLAREVDRIAGFEKWEKKLLTIPLNAPFLLKCLRF